MAGALLRLLLQWRPAGLLRQLSVFYAKQANHLYLVRVAQGLLHMGKGLVTLNPFHSDRFLVNNVALARPEGGGSSAPRACAGGSGFACVCPRRRDVRC